jgi:hypothetical protein
LKNSQLLGIEILSSEFYTAFLQSPFNKTKMMSIDPSHPLLVENLSKVLTGPDTPFTMTIPDYDGFLYLINYEQQVLTFSLIYEFVQSIGQAGGFEAIEQHLSGFPSHRADNSLTFQVNRSALPQDTEGQKSAAGEISSKFSMFRTVFFGGPFVSSLSNLQAGRPMQARQIEVRRHEKLWIIPGENRVSFVFQIFYQDFNDASLAKIFLQEIQDSKKQISNSPVISFGSSPPDIITSFRPKSEGLFLSVTILKDQVKHPVEQGRWLGSLKQYLSYHIHSCKTYLHMRMRKRTDALLQALKQAVPEKIQEKVFKKVRATKGIKEEAKIINNFRG